MQDQPAWLTRCSIVEGGLDSLASAELLGIACLLGFDIVFRLGFSYKVAELLFTIPYSLDWREGVLPETGPPPSKFLGNLLSLPRIFVRYSGLQCS
jgi:hypothetical protein